MSPIESTVKGSRPRPRMAGRPRRRAKGSTARTARGAAEHEAGDQNKGDQIADAADPGHRPGRLQEGGYDAEEEAAGGGEGKAPESPEEGGPEGEGEVHRRLVGVRQHRPHGQDHGHG